jgi:hypothetical protein
MSQLPKTPIPKDQLSTQVRLSTMLLEHAQANGQQYRSVAAACRDAADLMRDPDAREKAIRGLQEEAARADALAAFIAQLRPVTP